MGGSEKSPAHFILGEINGYYEKMLNELTDSGKSNIYLREIALIMEEKDILEGQLRVKENLIKNFEKEIARLSKK